MPLVTRRRALLAAAGSAFSIVAAACGDKREPAGAPAAAMPEPASLPARPGGTLGLGIVGLFVADLGRSLGFYRRLGLAIPDEVDTRSGAYRLRQPNGQILFWETYAYTRRDFPDYQPARGDRTVALEFGFATPRDVDAMVRTLTAAGAVRSFGPAQWGDVRYAVVLDPDEHQIALRFPLAG